MGTTTPLLIKCNGMRAHGIFLFLFVFGPLQEKTFNLRPKIYPLPFPLVVVQCIILIIEFVSKNFLILPGVCTEYRILSWIVAQYYY